MEALVQVRQIVTETNKLPRLDSNQDTVIQSHVSYH